MSFNHDLKEKIPFKKRLLKFLFPLFPVKLMSSIHLIVFVALLISIRLILNFFSIPILPFGFNISISWIPVYIGGFFFGPVFGLAFGFICDSLMFAISGGMWVWIYAIQEPIVGLVAGLFGSVFLVIKFKNVKLIIILQKVIIYFFVCFTIFVVVFQYYVVDGKFSSGSINNLSTFVIVSLVSISCYMVVNELHFFFYYRRAKRENNYSNLLLFLFISSVVIINICICSFILGPISVVEWTKMVSGRVPNNFIKYGAMYYLVPRVLKESIKTPIYIIILFGICLALKTPMKRFVNIAKNKW